jgi:hypothetical protein
LREDSRGDADDQYAPFSFLNEGLTTNGAIIYPFDVQSFLFYQGIEILFKERS